MQADGGAGVHVSPGVGGGRSSGAPLAHHQTSSPFLFHLHPKSHLALSTNGIDRVAGLAPLTRLETLSLARNALRRLDGVEAAGGSLTQLWVSYNSLDRLAGVEGLGRLKVLFAMHNRIAAWVEVERLGGLRELEEVAFAGNPIESAAGGAGAAAPTATNPAAPAAAGIGGATPSPAPAPPVVAAPTTTTTTTPFPYPYRIEILRRLPRLVKIDGVAVTGAERAAAIKAGLVGPAAAAAVAAAAASVVTPAPSPQAQASASPAVVVA